MFRKKEQGGEKVYIPQGGHFDLIKALQSSEITIGGFKPADEWMEHMARVFYSVLGNKLYEYFWTATSHCPRTGFAVANSFHRHLRALGKVPDEIIVHEYGIGNGNFGASFLHEMRKLDKEHNTDYFSRTTLVMCDFSDAVLNSARDNEFLMQFKDNVVLAKVDAETLEPTDPGHKKYFRPGSVHKMFSNELADELKAKVLIKKGAVAVECLMRPFFDVSDLISVGVHSIQSLYEAYLRGNVAALKAYPPEFFRAIGVELEQGKKAPNIPDLGLALRFMRPLRDEQSFAVNYGFHNHLKAAARLMNRKFGQGYDVFDIGERSASDINGIPLTIIRGNYCFPVNFPIVEVACKESGLKVAALEPHKDFVSRELDEPVAFADDVLSTHKAYFERGKNARDELRRKLAQAVGPNYRNILSYWFFRQQLRADFTPEKLRAEGFNTQEDIDAFYERVRLQGFFGIRTGLTLLTEEELKASMGNLEQLGLEKQKIMSASSPEHPFSRRFTHMRIMP